jgi:MFS family permease
VVAALFALTFCVAIILASFGVFLPVLSDAFGWSRGVISLALSINMLLGGLAGFVVGALADRYGPQTVLVPTVVLAGVGFALTATVDALWSFYLCIGVLVGIGASGIYVITTATVVRLFEERRGLVLGIVFTGLNLGSMVGAPLVALLVERGGWRAAYVVIGSAVALLGGLASLCVRLPATHAGARSPSGSQPGAGARGVPLAAALGSPHFWGLALAWLFLGIVFMMMTVHIVPYARDRGASLESASLALSAYGLGAVAGRVLLGAAADRFGTMPTTRWCFVLQLATLTPLVAAPPLWTVNVLLVGFGFAFAGADTLLVKVLPEVFGVRAIGSLTAVLTLGWRCGAAIGPPSAGFVHDATGSYGSAFAGAVLAVVISFVLLSLSASHRARRS